MNTRVHHAGCSGDAAGHGRVHSGGGHICVDLDSPCFAWVLRKTKLVPYNAEEEMKKRGARYEKGLIPFASYVVVDGRLVLAGPADIGGRSRGVLRVRPRKIMRITEFGGKACNSAEAAPRHAAS